MNFDKWWSINCWNYPNIERSDVKDIWEEGYECRDCRDDK